MIIEVKLFNIQGRARERREPMSRLRDYRKSKGVMAKKVAAYIGVSANTYRQYEIDPEKMPVWRALKACEYLGCDLDEIFNQTVK